MAKSASEWVLLLETAYESLLTGGVSSYSIAGRSFTKHDIATIREELDYWRAQASSESHGIVSIADQGTRTDAY